MNALCTELQPEEAEMFRKAVRGLQLAPTKWLSPNRKTSGSIATRTVQIWTSYPPPSGLRSISQNPFAFTQKKLKTKPNWQDRVVVVSKWKNLAGHPVGSVFQKEDLELWQ